MAFLLLIFSGILFKLLTYYLFGWDRNSKIIGYPLRFKFVCGLPDSFISLAWIGRDTAWKRTYFPFLPKKPPKIESWKIVAANPLWRKLSASLPFHRRVCIFYRRAFRFHCEKINNLYMVYFSDGYLTVTIRGIGY